jgi:type I restriction enzyme S subunit
MNWRKIPLADLVFPTAGSFVDGPFGSNLKAAEYKPEGVPIIRLQNIRPNEFLAKDIKFITPQKSAELSRHSYGPGDLVISKLGDPPGYACVVPPNAGSGIIVADVVRFRGNPELTDHRYLSHFLNSQEGRRQFLELSKGTTRTRVNLSSIKTIEIPIPPTLDEQKRIAAVLDKANALRRNRQESLHLTEKFLQSVFIDMFVRNSAVDDWKPRTIAWMAKEGKGAMRTGPFGSQLLHSEFVDRGIAVLGIDNAVKNRFEWEQLRFISPTKYQGLKRYKVFPGDLIITIMGTLGRCAIVPDDIPEAINTKHLCCITLDRKKCIPEFLHACLLHHPDVLRQLGVRTKGAVMPGLNMGIIKDLELPLPPIELQEQFKRVITASNAARINLEESQDSMENFFGALQQRAFRGELDLSRLVLDLLDDSPIAFESEKPSTKASKPERTALLLQAPNAIQAWLMELDATVSKGETIQWSADYFKYRILGVQPVPFSFSDVMQKAESVFDEPPPYEEIKDMILGLLGQGNGRALLRQRFDLHIDVKTKEVSGRKEIVFEPAP